MLTINQNLNLMRVDRLMVVVNWGKMMVALQQRMKLDKILTMKKIHYYSALQLP